MTYNVWSREDVVLSTRMQAIGRLVRDHSPDVIFFQVILNISSVLLVELLNLCAYISDI
jgi:hypothetical protein